MTLADGTATVVICPYSSILGIADPSGSFLPFIQISNTVGNYPYQNLNPATNIVGPFNNQVLSIINYGIDFTKVSFIST